MEEDKKMNDFFSAFGKYAETIAKQFATNFMGTEIEKTITDYENKAVNVLKSFGTGRDRIVELKASMADAVVSVTQLGGGLEDVVNIATAAGAATRTNLILTSDVYSKLYETSKATGVEMSTLTTKFTEAGFSLSMVNSNMQKVVDTARASGVNAKIVSSDVMANIGLMDKYNFQGGVEGLAKMATQAANMRISIQSMEKALTQAFNPESAIEMAASLQRLGVAQSDLLDPLRLMDLAQNDPAELQNQIVEMSKTYVDFNEKTKQFEIAPGAKRSMKELADALGMSESEFTKMAKASKEMDDKLQKISFPDTFTEDQKKFVSNMAQMGEGGEYMLRVDNKDLKIDEAMKLFQEQPAVYEKFIKESKPKSMEELAKEQLTTSERMAANIASIANRFGAAVASSETQEMANKASVELSETIPKLFSGEKLQVSGMRESGEKIAQDLIKGAQTGDIMGALGKAEAETKDYMSKAFTQVVDGAKGAFDDLSKSSNPLVNILSNLTEKATSLVEKHENLGTGFFNLTQTVNKTSEAMGGKTLPKPEIPKPTEPTTGEMKFTTPLKIEISLSGLAPGMSEAEIIKLFQEGKLNEVLSNALSEAAKGKTSEVPEKK